MLIFDYSETECIYTARCSTCLAESIKHSEFSTDNLRRALDDFAADGWSLPRKKIARCPDCVLRKIDPSGEPWVVQKQAADGTWHEVGKRLNLRAVPKALRQQISGILESDGVHADLVETGVKALLDGQFADFGSGMYRLRPRGEQS